MKNLILIFHASLQQEIADILRTLTGLTNFTFTQVEGHRTDLNNQSFSSTRDLVVGFSPYVRADILLDDAAVEGVIATLRSSVSGLSTSGMFLITNVEKYGQF